MEPPPTIDTLASRLKLLSPISNVKVTNLFSTHVQSLSPLSPPVSSGTRVRSSQPTDSKQPSVPMTVGEKQLAVENGLVPRLLKTGRGVNPENILDRMRELGVPGVNIAVIKDGNVAWSEGYGDLQSVVTGIDRLSQAGSTSKTVNALTILSIIDECRKAKIRATEKSSAVPAGNLTGDKPVEVLGGLDPAGKNSGEAPDQLGTNEANFSKKPTKDLAVTVLASEGSVPAGIAEKSSSIDQSKFIDLDTDVSTLLGKELWASIDPDGITKKEGNEVTVRRLLSHTAGMTVSGFQGYPNGATALNEEIEYWQKELANLEEGTEDYLNTETTISGLQRVKESGKLPNIEDTIKGKGRTPPVTVGWVPGTKYAYSGGGTSILQVLVEKVTGKPYAQVVQERVLDKLKMDDSTFSPDQTRVVTGTNCYCKTIPGGARRHPEYAAAALWSTAGDLARMTLGIQSCLEGKEGSLFSKELAREMVTPDPKIEGQYTALGLSAKKSADGSTMFSHIGGTDGFRCMFIGTDDGQGAVIMTNAAVGEQIINEIFPAIAKAYKWKQTDTLEKMAPPAISPSEEVWSVEKISAIKPEDWAKGFVGEYHFEEKQAVVTANKNGVYIQRTGDKQPYELFPFSENLAAARELDPGRFEPAKFELGIGNTGQAVSLSLWGTKYERNLI